MEAGRRREAALGKDLAAERERYERHTLDLELEKAGGCHSLTIVRSNYKSLTQLFYLFILPLKRPTFIAAIAPQVKRIHVNTA